MILTICVFTFASLVAVDPVSEECFRTDTAGLAKMTTVCDSIAKDPISTCEIQRVGATKYYVRVRHLAGSSDEAPARVAKKERA